MGPHGEVTLTEFLLARIAEEESAARMAQAEPMAAMNITRWHPAHVLADCEAKRRIVAEIREHEFMGYDYPGPILELLALPYADHPDYDEAWRP